MNSANKRPAGVGAVPQRLNQQAGRAPAQSVRKPAAPPAFRPQVMPKAVQPKMAGGAPNRKTPAAPPVYRPQQAPKVLQAKSPSGRSPQTGQARPQPVAPPVYRPEAKSLVQPKAVSQLRQPPTAPPVYRPEQGRVAQPKMAAAHAHTPPKAPPACRPQAQPTLGQSRLPVQMKSQQPAPSAHQPQPGRTVLQTKNPVAAPVAQRAQSSGTTNAIQLFKVSALWDNDVKPDTKVLGLHIDGDRPSFPTLSDIGGGKGDAKAHIESWDMLKNYYGDLLGNNMKTAEDIVKILQGYGVTVSFSPSVQQGINIALTTFFERMHRDPDNYYPGNKKANTKLGGTVGGNSRAIMSYLNKFRTDGGLSSGDTNKLNEAVKKHFQAGFDTPTTPMAPDDLANRVRHYKLTYRQVMNSYGIALDPLALDDLLHSTGAKAANLASVRVPVSGIQ